MKVHITRISPMNGRLDAKHCRKATMEIKEEIASVLLKNAMKPRIPIVDVEHLPKDKIKRKWS